MKLFFLQFFFWCIRFEKVKSIFRYCSVEKLLCRSAVLLLNFPNISFQTKQFSEYFTLKEENHTLASRIVRTWVCILFQRIKIKFSKYFHFRNKTLEDKLGLCDVQISGLKSALLSGFSCSCDRVQMTIYKYRDLFIRISCCFELCSKNGVLG